MLGEYARMIEARTYEGDGLKLNNGAQNLRAIRDYGTINGVDTDLFASAHRSFEAATSSGHGPTRGLCVRVSPASRPSDARERRNRTTRCARSS